MISTAILLAAGEGTRLRSSAPFKPLCTVGWQPLIAHAIEGLAQAGMERVIVVLGYGAEEIGAYVGSRNWPLVVETVTNEDYRQPNGVSVLAAEPLVVGGEALLAMCDHLVDPALYRIVAQAGASAGARLAVDRRLDNPFVDLDDVTRVESAGEGIVNIGKGFEPYDCFDTGVFAIGPALFAALRSLPSPSLSDGMRALANDEAAFVLDCGDLGWIDVDDEAALAKAEQWVETRK